MKLKAGWPKKKIKYFLYVYANARGELIDSGLFFNTPVTGLENSIIFQHWASRCDSTAPEGSITLFPGFLKHGIQTHQGTTDRISLSFNIYFDKEALFKSGEIFS